MQPRDIENLKEHTVIVGGGLAGLTAAVEASNAGKKVLVIESREELNSAIRPQFIFLNEDTIKYLRFLKGKKNTGASPDDEQFIQKLQFLNGEHFGIKDIQRFLKSRINPKFCTFLYDSKISEINIEKGFLITSNPDDKYKIKFHHIILADGASSETSQLLKEHIQYRPVQGRPEIKHAMAYLTVTLPADRLENPMDKAIAYLADGDYYGLIYHERSTLPKDDPTKVKICVVMHVSSERFLEFSLNREAMIDYLKHCAKSVFGEDAVISMPESQKSGLAKDRLKACVFKLDFQEATTSALRVNDHLVVLAGDTKRSPDFYQGHGGNDAIKDGRLAVKLIIHDIHLEEYKKYSSDSSKNVSRITKQIQPISEYAQENSELAIFSVSPFESKQHTFTNDMAKSSVFSDPNQLEIKISTQALASLDETNAVTIHLPKPSVNLTTVKKLSPESLKQKTDALVSLDAYIVKLSKRIEKNKNGKNHSHGVFKKGFTDGQKINAAEALKQVIEGGADEAILKKHEDVLNKGSLKKIYHSFKSAVLLNIKLNTTPHL